MLRETKEAANQEYDRLKTENERLRDSFTAKLKEKEKECKLTFFLHVWFPTHVA